VEERSLQRTEGGLGIGLTLVKELVEMHGGTVVAHSDGPGTGSSFEVRLPLAAAPTSGPAPEGPREQRPSGGRTQRVLVVDDNRDAVESLAILLEMMGYEVRTAGDGLEAVTETQAFSPDVVLLDIGLPVLNGYEAAERIRALDGGGSVVLVALTGWGQEEDRRRSREAGFDHHLVKPVDPDALEALLRRVVPGDGSGQAAT
jgi:CheY-like chemotaxis protein